MIGNDWDKVLNEEYQKEYFKDLKKFVESEYKTKTIYPLKENIFNAFKLTKYQDVKVVILGQDPYHEKGEAQGLAFSVPDNIKRPPSLKNIFKELENDLKIQIPEHNSLIEWAKQGILMMNTVLTVEEHKANSHKNKGWEIFTDEVIKKINDKDTPVVFILWGNNARTKKNLITNKIHHIIESAHPSPLSAYHGFFGSKPFSKTNDYLKKDGLKEINWTIK